MKKTLAVIFSTALVIFSAVNIQAGLINAEEYPNLVYDNTNNLYWYDNLPDLTSMTYDQQLAFIGNLENAAGYSMATAAEMELLWGYGAAAIADVFTSTGMADGYIEFYG
jgi:hypothetical protein